MDPSTLRVLLLEDDRMLSDTLSQQLASRGCQVSTAYTLAAATRLATDSGFDIYIVDRAVSDGDGQDWLLARRQIHDQTPAIFLTALGALADKVKGLSLADDYLVKPFAVEELWARMQALSRRSTPTETTEWVVNERLTIRRLQRAAYIDGVDIRLKPMEFKLLEYLLLNRGHTVTRTMILESVWGFNFDPTTNIVQTYISRLRAQLDCGDAQPLIETVRGEGYRIAAAHPP